LIFQQFYLGCLSHASYLIADGGKAVVVDPQRDVEQYLDFAKAHGLTIAHVAETHLHADFVSGHRELAERTGATIHLGRAAGATFPHRALDEGDRIELGGVRLVALETPGHTPESLCYVVYDDAQGPEPVKVLTGDTLFVGEVGRPDLVTSSGHTASEMARRLYDSLHRKLLALPDAVEVYPAHGAGSACGRNIGQELSTTIGEQRRMNYALQPMSEEAFVELVATDLPAAPAYFAHDAEANRRGAPALQDLPPPPELAPAEFRTRQAEGAVVLDVRDGVAYFAGHVPGAIHVGLGGQFASWAGSLVPVASPILLVADDHDGAAEARLRLARVGLEHVVGTLEGGFAEWVRCGEPIESIGELGVEELAARLGNDGSGGNNGGDGGGDGAGGGRDGGGGGDPAAGLRVLDVRRAWEFASGHVPGAVNVPLDELPQRLDEIDASAPLAIVCQSGYRSAIAASLLAPRRKAALYNVAGGTTAWKAAGLPLEPA
jgi:glyoxylase-like metal-dependent hydrolase (beta-lactamase superfamily II)/rhodanese-related sulfurtransferase